MNNKIRIYITILALLTCIGSATSQSNDLYEGVTQKIPYSHMIVPYGIQVSYHKTVHLIFPSAVKYVDLGSINIIAGKADGVENVLRVKAAIEEFETETNFSVICEDGSFYSFNAKYAKEPELLNIEMKDFINYTGLTDQVSTSNNMDIHFPELNSEPPVVINIIQKSIYKNNCTHIKHLGSKRFGVQFLIKGIYSHNDLLYIHTQTKNASNIKFNTDFIRFKIIDKKLAKRTAIQETFVIPVRTYNEVIEIRGKTTVRTVYTLPAFTIPDDKILLVELVEKNGGRNQIIRVEHSDLNRAKQINEQKIM